MWRAWNNGAIEQEQIGQCHGRQARILAQQVRSDHVESLIATEIERPVVRAERRAHQEFIALQTIEASQRACGVRIGIESRDSVVGADPERAACVGRDGFDTGAGEAILDAEVRARAGREIETIETVLATDP